MAPTWGASDRLEHHFGEGRVQVFQTDRTWKRAVVQSRDGRTVLLVHAEDETGAAVRALNRELEFNMAVAERAGTDQLGTAFGLDAVQRLLTSGIADHLGPDIHATYSAREGR